MRAARQSRKMRIIAAACCAMVVVGGDGLEPPTLSV
jgi:hypothetical protein